MDWSKKQLPVFPLRFHIVISGIPRVESISKKYCAQGKTMLV
jgi:hypothetical protein